MSRMSALLMAALERLPDSPPGTWQARVLRADGSNELRTVRIGVTDLVLGEVLEGLADGDEVLLNVTEATSPEAPGADSAPGPEMFVPGV